MKRKRRRMKKTAWQVARSASSSCECLPEGIDPWAAYLVEYADDDCHSLDVKTSRYLSPHHPSVREEVHLMERENMLSLVVRVRQATEVNVVVPTKGNAYGPVRSLLVMANTETLASDRWQRERCSKGKAQPLRCCCRNRTASREKNDELSAREIPYLGTMISSSSPLEDK